MSRLVPFKRAKKSRERAAIGPVPSDALERSEWVHKLLCEELAIAYEDEELTDKERRDAVQRLTAKIIAATPNHELYLAKQALKDAERKQTASKRRDLGGKVTDRGSQAGPGHLRADSPRKRERKSSVH